MNNNQSVNEIVRIEEKGLNTFIHFQDGQFERLSTSIDDIEKRFASWDFIRIHPRHLINPRFYKNIVFQQTPCVEMIDGIQLPTDSRLIDVETWDPKPTLTFWGKIKKNFHL